ncbi:MAG TPA: O-antigen ligase family protein [Solirubrobacteraceae bacterium]|nr:O-antigen ligase family protein [Solirubrobacteraceae bacterium]
MSVGTSTLAGSPDATAARLPRPAPIAAYAAAPRGRGGPALAGTIALLLAGTAFVADGGLRLERTTYVEIALMLLGAALCAAALLVPRARVERLHGGLTLTAVALLAAYTAVSITWSLAPSDSWIEANRTFSYLAAFAGTMALARLAPGRWPAVLHGISLACVAVCGWALVTKVFPGALAEEEIYARLRAPFDYWNAVGLMAALGILPLLWLGARRSGRGAAGALAWPGIALLEVALMLSYSRGALLALAVGLAFWFAVVPLRLRSAVVLLGATAGAAPVVGWAFSMTGLNTDRLPLAVRADTGHELGALLLVMLAALLALGLAARFLAAERPASPQAKAIAGRVLLGVVAAVPVIALIALASASGGIDGQVSKGWDRLTNPNASTPDNTPGRLTATSSVRARYWDEAFGVHGVSPWVGTGAGAYATVRMRFRTGTLFVRHAHGYVPQTLADLGWAGLGLSLLALALWGWAAIKAIGMRPRDRGLPWDAERAGMAALIAVALIFGVHSAVDWTWFVPANALCGLIAAAWVVARPSLRSRMEAAALAGAVPAAVRDRPRDAAPLWSPPTTEPPRAADVAGPGALPVADAGWRRRAAFPWPALAGAVVVLALALTAAWAAFQPVRSVNAGDVAIERLQQGGLEAAVSVARIAHDRNPLSPEPLWELAYIEQQRGRLADAGDALEEAVRIQPASAEAWRRLGRFQLSTLNQPSDALGSFRAAYFLDPRNPASASDFLEASRANGQPGALPPASP